MGFLKKAIIGKKPKIKDATVPEFRELRSPLSNQLLGLLNNGFPQFGSDFTAPIGQGEADAISRINLLAQGQGQSAEGDEAAQNLLTRTLRGDFLSPDSNPFLAATIRAASRPILEQFDDALLAQRAQFTANGQSVVPTASSPFALAEARRQIGLANALGDVGTNIAFSNLANERALQNQAATLQQQRQQQELQTQLAALEANGLPRLIEQFGIDQGLAEFQRQQAQLLQLLGITGNLALGQQIGIPGTGGLLQAFTRAFGNALGRRLGG